MAEPIFTGGEISILRTLVQDHLNTVSDLACHYVGKDVVGYLGVIEDLEAKLKRIELSEGGGDPKETPITAGAEVTKPWTFTDDSIRRTDIPRDAFALLHDLCKYHDGKPTGAILADAHDYAKRAQQILSSLNLVAPMAAAAASPSVDANFDAAKFSEVLKEELYRRWQVHDNLATPDETLFAITNAVAEAQRQARKG